ncbi:MAG: hypothetical protein AB7P16_24965 [Bradyrhizobium sp.]|uniref:hypothetical protein n=1 Tax=Bradyrhizobium sp. TaxID=376 RepID=UPI003D0C5147
MKRRTDILLFGTDAEFLTWAAKSSWCIAWYQGARWAWSLRVRAGEQLPAAIRAAMATFERAMQP